MNKKRTTYNRIQQLSAVFMILALCWLTVSAPFVVAGQQALAKQGKAAAQQAPLSDNDEETTTNPFGNNTEEKAPTGSNSFSEEYLHDHHTTDYFFSVIASYHKCENAGTYVAFHGELDVPPPDQA